MRKHKLLREDILPAMASNRKVQRLLNEFMDLLSEYETVETNVDKKDPAPPLPADTPASVTDPMDTAPMPPAIDQMDITPTPSKDNDKNEPVPIATDQENTTVKPMGDQANPSQVPPSTTNEVNMSEVVEDSDS